MLPGHYWGIKNKDPAQNKKKIWKIFSKNNTTEKKNGMKQFF